MLLFGRRERDQRVANLSGYYGDHAGATGAQLIPPRVAAAPGLPPVTHETALRHSAVWACLRLRADLVSTFPVDIFRAVTVDGRKIDVEMPKPPMFRLPGGELVDWVEWMYSSQVDLDRAGNVVGLITERNAAGLPGRIDLQPITSCTLREYHDQIEWKIDNKTYTPAQVWHEKQFTVAGLPVGLSPVAFAAWTLGEHASIQDFALSWFSGGGVPRGHLRNKMQTIKPSNAEAIKARFKATVASGDVFVTGNDWEYSMLQAEQTGNEWLEAKRYSVSDIARFFGVPGDLIDAAIATGNITYANITQRNLQFLIYHLGPVIYRREQRLSRLLPAPRFVKLNTSALLRMDDANRAKVLANQIASRILTPNEARELDDRPPLTTEDEAEFERLFGDPNLTSQTSTGAGGDPF